MASGAYVNVSPDGCTVLTSALPTTGSSFWCPQVNPGVGYAVANWNKLYPAYPLPCHPHCPGCSQSSAPAPAPPSGSPTAPAPAPPPPPPSAGVPPTETPPAPPQKPVTGPKEADPCAPAMSQRVGDDFGFDTQEHLTMPRVGEFHFVRHGNTRGLTAEPPTTSGASYVKAPDVRATHKGGAITVADLGTGDGYTVFHPSDVNEFGLRGDSVHPEGAWPAAISRVALLLLNAERNANTTGDDAKTYLAFGLPSARPELRGKPRSGVYFDFDPATGVLNIQHTDADGDDATVANGVTIDGSPIGSGSVTFPLAAPDNGVANYAFSGNSTPGSENAGMAFVPADEGPSLTDIAGTAQLKVTTAGVTIPGKLTVTGLIDPTGLELTPVAANPGGTAANTLWLDSTASNVLKHGANRVMLGSNNLSEVTNAATARSNIGAGTASITGVFVVGNLVKSDGAANLEDAGYAASAVYRSGGTDVPITDGGTGASDADGAINNIVSAATNRTPVLADRFPFEVAAHASQAGAATFQQALNLIGSLTAETTLDPANDKIALYDSSGAATDSMTPQAFMNGMQNLAQATSATRDFKVLALDASNIAKYVNLDDLDPTGQVLICRTVSYTGSGSSGKTVTLTGINRAHVLSIFKSDNSGTNDQNWSYPVGGTGSQTVRNTAGSSSNWVSLDAPAAGTNQVLTINSTAANENASGVNYRIVVWGTPT